MVNHRKPERLANPGPLLGVLRGCRQAMVAASGEVKAGGTYYHGFTMVIAAIDSLAELMIRRPDYFWAQGTAQASQAMRERARLEQEAEAGLRPWPETEAEKTDARDSTPSGADD